MTHRTPALVARFSLFTVCLFAVSLSTGCANESTADKPEERLLPSSSGTHHDLAIFCNDKVWFDGVGLAVAETFAAPVNGLPQAEKRFLASQLPHKAASSLIKRFKSVLSLQIIPDSSGIVVAKDVWARPQMVVQVIAPNAAAMARIIRSNAPEMMERFEAHNQMQLTKRLKKTSASPIPSSLTTKGIDKLVISKFFQTTFENDHVAILRMDTKKSLQFMMISSLPIITGSIESRIIQRRDSLLDLHFTGQSEGSKIVTEMALPPHFRNLSVDGKYSVETHGLFKTVGGIGGGPFVSLSIFDEANNRVLTLDCIVFAPGSKKRKILLELEAMIHSVILKK